VYLSDFDLQQLDEQKLRALPAEQKEALLVKLLWDLKDARERLKANSQTSSRPPRSDSPWQSHDSADEEVNAAEDEGGERESEVDDSAASTAAAESSEVAIPAVETTPASPADQTPKKAGRQVGAPGRSRQVSLPVSATVNQAPASCACCGQALEPTEFIARTGLYVLEIETDPEAGLRGLRVRHDKHLYGEITCRCGHVNRSEPGRCPTDPLWTVGLTEWHLVGPLLVSLLVCLSPRMHLSRRRIQEFLRDWLGIELSTRSLSDLGVRTSIFPIMRPKKRTFRVSIALSEGIYCPQCAFILAAGRPILLIHVAVLNCRRCTPNSTHLAPLATPVTEIVETPSRV